MAQNFLPCDREQVLLMPPSLREWLPEDHFAWFVLAAVEEMDLRKSRLPLRMAPDHRHTQPPEASQAPDSAHSDLRPTPRRHRDRLNHERGRGRRPQRTGTVCGLCATASRKRKRGVVYAIAAGKRPGRPWLAYRFASGAGVLDPRQWRS